MLIPNLGIIKLGFKFFRSAGLIVADQVWEWRVGELLGLPFLSGWLQSLSQPIMQQRQTERRIKALFPHYCLAYDLRAY